MLISSLNISQELLEVIHHFWWADNGGLLAETANSRVEHIADLHFCRNGEVIVIGGREGSTLSHSDKVGRVSLLRRKTSHYVPRDSEPRFCAKAEMVAGATRKTCETAEPFRGGWARRVYFAYGEVGRVSLLRRKTSQLRPKGTRTPVLRRDKACRRLRWHKT